MDERDNKLISSRNFIFGLITGAAVVALIVTYLSREEAVDQLVPAATPAPEGESANALEPAARPAEVLPSFDVVRISRGGTGVIAGRAAPGTTIEVLADGTVVGVANTEGNGAWVMIVDQPLPPGPAELSLIARNDAGQVFESRDVVVVAVPDRARQDEFVETLEGGVVAVLTPRDGQGPSRVLQKPGSSPLGEIADQLTLDTIDYDESGEVMIAGRSKPRAEIAAYLDNEFLGVAKSDDAGRWSLQPEQVLDVGEHVLRVDQLIGEGEVQVRIEQPFAAGLPFDATEQKQKVYVQPGNSLWHIARLIYGSGFRYTLIFQENAEQIRDPDLIYPGQEFVVPRAAGRDSHPG